MQWNWMWTSLASAFEHLYDQGMSQAMIEQDWDLVASLAADLHDAHGRLVDAVAVALAEGSWEAAGIRSPEHWVVVRAGLSRRHAAGGRAAGDGGSVTGREDQPGPGGGRGPARPGGVR